MNDVAHSQNNNLLIRNLWLDIFLTLLTCGIWNARVQFVQMEALNLMQTRHQYSFWKWAVLCLLTCGIWHIYHQWRMSEDVAIIFKRDQGLDSIIAVVLTLVAFPYVADAIRQSFINQYFEQNS